MSGLVTVSVVHPGISVPLAVRTLHFTGVRGGQGQFSFLCKCWSRLVSWCKTLRKPLSISGCAAGKALRGESTFWGNLIQCPCSSGHTCSKSSSELLDCATKANTNLSERIGRPDS